MTSLEAVLLACVTKENSIAHITGIYKQVTAV